MCDARSCTSSENWNRSLRFLLFVIRISTGTVDKAGHDLGVRLSGGLFNPFVRDMGSASRGRGEARHGTRYLLAILIFRSKYKIANGI